ncbi:hypothetical protein KA001_02100 [Patescibacteria group bacterium]|nr:hypothetical protein [Patescibacteria group bacterium]
MYIYKPKILKSRNSTSTKISINVQEKKYIHQIVLYFSLSIAVVVIAFFSFILIFSNINNLWGIFKPKDIYKAQDVSTVGRPFVQVDNTYTNKDTVDILVKAQSGLKVKLYKNSNVQNESIASNENSVDFKNITITNSEGATTNFYAVAYDSKNKESEKSNTVTITYDKTKPKFEITYPKNGETVKSFIRNITVKGKTEKDTQVFVNDAIARTDENNEFSATIKTEEGENIIKVKVVDKALNETWQEIKINFDKQDI